MKNELPILAFEDVVALRAWLMKHHATSDGIWIRISKKYSGVKSVSFEDVLDEGLCFGWSESLRRTGDGVSYLQKFAPRKSQGTTSERNKAHVEYLVRDGRMTPAGLAVLAV